MTEICVESYVMGKWQGNKTRKTHFLSPFDGSKLSVVLQTDISGEEILNFSRREGIKSLQDLNFHERAKAIKQIALLLDKNKDSLYRLSYLTGATLKDSYLDIDGGIGTLLVMSSKVRKEMDENFIGLEGDTEILSKNGTFLGQHILSPLRGVAIHINAFNFPIWGMLEKLSCSILAGVPTIIKASSVTSFLSQACLKIITESNILPKGSIQFIPGNLNNLLNHLNGQDVISFTGSAKTGIGIRSNPNLLRHSVKFIAEQDSLNACILGQDVKIGEIEWNLFLKEVVNEITSKSGQKCTAIRRVFVPEHKLQDTENALQERLKKLKVGDPHDPNVEIGPLVSSNQKDDVLEKASILLKETNLVLGSNNFGNNNKVKGTAFVNPILFHCSDSMSSKLVHDIEVFGPAATVMGYRNYDELLNLVKRGEGSLVSSIFSADLKAIKKLSLGLAPYNGRIYINNKDSMEESTGHGSPLPHMKHGGPGRAGNGEELGGLRGINNYMQRTAIQGSPNALSEITNCWIEGGSTQKPEIHPFKKSFDDLSIGDTIFSEEKKISLNDISNFAEFTGDKFYAHMNEEAAKQNPFFPGRVAHGYLLVSFAAGLFVDPDPGPVLANTGLKNLVFQKPVSPGDKIRVQLTVKSKKRRTETYGEVRWFVKLENQDKAVVAKYELHTMNSYVN